MSNGTSNGVNYNIVKPKLKVEKVKLLVKAGI